MVKCLKCCFILLWKLFIKFVNGLICCGISVLSFLCKWCVKIGVVLVFEIVIVIGLWLIIDGKIKLYLGWLFIMFMKILCVLVSLNIFLFMLLILVVVIISICCFKYCFLKKLLMSVILFCFVSFCSLL